MARRHRERRLLVGKRDAAFHIAVSIPVFEKLVKRHELIPVVVEGQELFLLEALEQWAWARYLSTRTELLGPPPESIVEQEARQVVEAAAQTILELELEADEFGNGKIN